MTGVTTRLRDSLAAFAAVFRNPALRRVQLAWGASMIGSWSYGIALSVYAFQADGAYAVGLVGMIRWVVAAAVAPFTGALADRYPRERVMLVSLVVRVLAVAGIAVVTAVDGPSLVVYGVSVAVTAAATAFRPAQAALIPSLATTPQELTASNVTSSTIESVGIFVGPALGGFTLAVSSVSVVFGVTAALFLAAAVGVARLPAVRERPAEPRERRRLVSEIVVGIRTLVAEPQIALLVSLFAAQTFVDGALGVLLVILALDVLELGSSGLGALNSAAGIGGLIGAVVAAALVGRSRLASDFGFGIVLWGLPILVLGIWPNAVIAIPMLALVGIGNTIVDVTGDTLLQRSVADDVLARVFALMESLMLITVALGAVTAPLLADLFGTRTALVATGALLPVLALLTWRRLRAIDAAAAHLEPGRQLQLLRSLPIFAPLPPPELEALAGRMEHHRFAPGEIVVRQGDPGDRFHVIADGEVDVAVDGAARPRLGQGDFFGEIALLRDVPRTATVTAAGPVETFSLDREDFVSAVTGHSDSADAAAAAVRARLGPHTGMALG